MIDLNQDQISLRHQCRLLNVNRSTLYYQAVAPQQEDTHIANEIHQVWLAHPMYGYRRITAHLHREGVEINSKKVQRLMHQMQIQALYPRPRLSPPSRGHEVYPYLLKGLSIVRPDQVWATDITYLKMACGFAYLVALIDIYSRYIVSWRVSNTMDRHFCLSMLEEGLSRASPGIINTDQGSQFTSQDWIQQVEGSGVRVSMDGAGRWADNIIIERFWRTLKHEHFVYQSFDSIRALKESIGKFITFYNYDRLHSSLGYVPPWEAYSGVGRGQSKFEGWLTDGLRSPTNFAGRFDEQTAVRC